LSQAEKNIQLHIARVLALKMVAKRNYYIAKELTTLSIEDL